MAQDRRLNVVLTSFGPFMTIKENPSDHVRQNVVSKFEEMLQVGSFQAVLKHQAIDD